MANLKAYMPVEEVIAKGYITDVEICAKLKARKLDLEDPRVAACVTQPEAYKAIYVAPVDDPTTPNRDESIKDSTTQDYENALDNKAEKDAAYTTDQDSENDIKFDIILNNERSTTGERKNYSWKGSTTDLTVADIFKKLRTKKVDNSYLYWTSMDGMKKLTVNELALTGDAMLEFFKAPQGGTIREFFINDPSI